MRIRFLRVAFCLAFCVFWVACGSPGSSSGPFAGGNSGQPPVIQKPTNIVVSTPRSQPAFLQFNEAIGNIPQRPFDPMYAPKSRTAQNKSLSREGSGALLYTIDQGRRYVLIGKERSNGYWNFMRGSVDAGDNYVKAAENEIHQETGGTYSIAPAVLLSESYDIYLSPARHNYACTFFVKVPYVLASEILSNSKKHSDPHYQEMTDYLWIELDDLVHALQTHAPIFSATDISASKVQISFYLYSFKILVQANAKKILSNLD